MKAFQTGNKPKSFNRRWPQSDPYSAEIAQSSSSESESYSNDKRPIYDVNESQSPMTPIRQLVRLFGLQPNQISAVAINAIVFVTQLVCIFLIKKNATGMLL